MIPTYNQEASVKQAVSSALDQTYPELEVVVSDDHSSDRTWEILQQFDDPRLRISRNQTNRGKSENYQILLYKLARGKYVLNLDGDDELIQNNYVERAVEQFFSAEDDIVMVTAERLIKTSRDTIHIVKPLDKIQPGLEVFKKHFEGTFSISHMTCIYPRELATSLNFYRQSIPSEDRLGILKLILHGMVGFIPEQIGIRNVHQGSISYDLTVEQIHQNSLSVTAPLDYAVSNDFLDPETAERLKKKRLKKHYFDKFVEKLMKRNWRQAYQLFNHSVKNDVFSPLYPLVKSRSYLSLVPPAYRIAQNFYLAVRNRYRLVMRSRHF